MLAKKEKLSQEEQDERWESAKTAHAKRAAERAAEQLRKQGEADSVAQRRADFAQKKAPLDEIKLAELKRVRASHDEILLDEIEKLSIAGAGLKQPKVVLFDWCSPHLYNCHLYRPRRLCTTPRRTTKIER